jgi:serine/threonine-protein kinase RsbW
MQKKTFSAYFSNLDDIREFVSDCARGDGFSEKEIYSIQLAVDEACTNVIEHAYGGEGDETLEISCVVSDEVITVTIRDWGKPFNPSNVPEPNLEEGLFERRIGGLGVYLMRKLMDTVSYIPSSESGNILTLTKRKWVDR